MTIAPTDILEIEGHLLLGWPPLRTEPLGGWTCALDQGVTRRANSVWPLAWTNGVPLEAAIARVEQTYRSAGLLPRFKMTTAALPGSLDQALAQRGYLSEGASHVLVADLASLPTAPTSHVETRLFPSPNDAWRACYEIEWHTERERTATQQIFTRLSHPHVFGVAIHEGRVASVALAVSTGKWVQVSAVRTFPEIRRQGLARAVMTALTVWAREKGATGLILQVEAGNNPALTLYGKAGFRHVYDYYYRAAP